MELGDGWVETAILGKHSYAVRLGMAGNFFLLFLWSTSVKILEVALRFGATDS